MMKLTLWVQFTLKKSNVDGKNLLYLKDPTCQKLCLFISVLLKISFHKSFCLIPQLWLPCSSFEFRSNYGKSDDFEIEEPWNIWNIWENLKLFLQLKKYSSEGLGSQIRYWMVWLSPIINYGTPFPNNNLLLSLRSSLRINQHSERRLAKALS